MNESSQSLSSFKFYCRDDQNCYYQKNNGYIFSKRTNESMSDLKPYQNADTFNRTMKTTVTKSNEGFVIGLKRFLRMI